MRELQNLPQSAEEFSAAVADWAALVERMAVTGGRHPGAPPEGLVRTPGGERS